MNSSESLEARQNGGLADRFGHIELPGSPAAMTPCAEGRKLCVPDFGRVCLLSVMGLAGIGRAPLFFGQPESIQGRGLDIAHARQRPAVCLKSLAYRLQLVAMIPTRSGCEHFAMAAKLPGRLRNRHP